MVTRVTHTILNIHFGCAGANYFISYAIYLILIETIKLYYIKHL